MLILINELSADAEFRNNIPSIHLITIFASMVCSGYFACMIDMDMDTSEHYRSTETKLFGWVPESRIVRTIFAIFRRFIGILSTDAHPFHGCSCLYATCIAVCVACGRIYRLYVGKEAFPNIPLLQQVI